MSKGRGNGGWRGEDGDGVDEREWRGMEDGEVRMEIG